LIAHRSDHSTREDVTWQLLQLPRLILQPPATSPRASGPSRSTFAPRTAHRRPSRRIPKAVGHLDATWSPTACRELSPTSGGSTSNRSSSTCRTAGFGRPPWRSAFNRAHGRDHRGREVVPRRPG